MPAAIIRLRRNTSVEWAALDPILMSGEATFETDTHRLKIGDGVTNYSALDYYLPASDFDELIAEALANTGAMAALNAHIASLTPHSVYDDGPSLALLYENAKV